jgi:YHS domain-containing protein
MRVEQRRAEQERKIVEMKSGMKLSPSLVSRACVLASIALLSIALLPIAMSSTGLYARGRQQSEQSKEHSLVQVESKYVCMVNNQRFDKELIPVKVNDRTYYGCCEMCKDKLQNNAKSRVAKDPVSGKEVDKSIAVIGAAPDGKVFYFESVENLRQYKGQ